MSLLVVGSIAFDSIETPHGVVEDALGGSATFFSYAASFFTKPRLVGVVGEDFPEDRHQILVGRGVDTAGLVRQKGGKTFRWKGKYHPDMNGRDTLEVHLNVFGTFDPVLPESFRDSTHVFLANGSPVVQAKVLDQVKKPQLVMADTMDLWISTQHDQLVALLPRLDGLLLNDSEAKLLTDEDNLVRAGHKVRALGPKFVIIKKGEHGAILFSQDGIFVVPAYPIEQVIDPTGAGDSFAGGVMGHLITDQSQPPGRLRRAMAYGTVVASLAVEGFGLDRLQRTSREEIDARLEQYRTMLAFWRGASEGIMGRLRTFIAVDPGKAIRDRLAALQESLGRSASDVKWVERDNLHLTLLFLGEVDDREVPQVCRAVTDTAATLARFPLSVERAGCFGSPRRPRTLWVGVGEGTQEVVALHDALEAVLLELGCYRREERKFSPHITLGRVKSDRPNDALATALARQSGWKGGEVNVSEVLVLSSELTPSGPIYTVLSRSPLGGKAKG